MQRGAERAPRTIWTVARALTAFFAVAASIGMTGSLASTSAEPSHGLSAFGDLKYPADFAHFEYARPDAPKGGRLALVGTRGLTTFDSFNGYILRGDAAQGTSTLFEGFSLIFDTLMTRANDEPDAVYGLVAKTADVAADRMSVRFELRPEARFADGSALTSEDVKFSFDVLKAKGHPIYASLLRDVVSATVEGPHAITFRFKGTQLRDLPLNVATLPIFSKAYYQQLSRKLHGEPPADVDAKCNAARSAAGGTGSADEIKLCVTSWRDIDLGYKAFEETSLIPPLGSGPYRIETFKAGTFVSYKRRDDYWAKDLPVNRGRWNFDEIRFEYFRDRTASLESLKAGAYDLREEFTSKDWATGYDIPQVRDGRMVLTTLADQRPSGAQGFFINTRKDKFSDIRVREALDLAFDYEWTNKNLFYSLYKRTTSYFENSPLKASGKPDAAEAALLEPFRDKLPADVFAQPYSPPISDGSGTDRRLLREAIKLLEAAGYKMQGNRRVTPSGEPFTIEFLTFESSFHRVIQPYIASLNRIGIDATIRQVDPAQYERRSKSFDFDILTQRFSMGLTPGIALKSYMSSEAAAIEGSFNLAGIRHPVVDALIETIISAQSRDALTTATRALDRVLRANHYWVPHWYKAAHNIAHWDRFSRPETKPLYADGVIDTWWYDTEKAARIANR